MGHALLRHFIEKEGPAFQQIENRWRPQHLLMSTQVRATIHDMEHRYEALSVAEEEFSTLDRRDLYIKLIRRMRISLRASLFSWKADQLRFLRSVAEFYTDFGAILRLLKFDQLRGLLTD